MIDLENNLKPGQIPVVRREFYDNIKRKMDAYTHDPSKENKDVIIGELARACAYGMTYYAPVYESKDKDGNSSFVIVDFKEPQTEYGLPFIVYYKIKDKYFKKDSEHLIKVKRYSLSVLIKHFLSVKQYSVFAINTKDNTVFLSKEVAKLILKQAKAFEKANETTDIKTWIPLKDVHQDNVLVKLSAYDKTQNEKDKVELLDALAKACIYDVHFYCPARLDAEQDADDEVPDINYVLFTGSKAAKEGIVYPVYSRKKFRDYSDNFCHKNVKLLNILNFFMDKAMYSYLTINYNMTNHVKLSRDDIKTVLKMYKSNYRSTLSIDELNDTLSSAICSYVETDIPSKKRKCDAVLKELYLAMKNDREWYVPYIQEFEKDNQNKTKIIYRLAFSYLDIALKSFYEIKTEKIVDSIYAFDKDTISDYLTINRGVKNSFTIDRYFVKVLLDKYENLSLEDFDSNEWWIDDDFPTLHTTKSLH